MHAATHFLSKKKNNENLLSSLNRKGLAFGSGKETLEGVAKNGSGLIS